MAILAGLLAARSPIRLGPRIRMLLTKFMNIAIIGAGFTGLAAAYELQKKGHTVTIFEKDSRPGGLAIGYQEKEWEWSLEYHYHHWFTNDHSVLNLAKEINYPVLIRRPKTSVYVKNHLYQLDSPLKLLTFPKLSPIERFRMAATLGVLRYNPLWKPYEKVHAIPFLKTTMGKKGYEMIWEPQLINKFGDYKDEMSLAWFWARIKKRTSSLAYPSGGFLKFAESLADEIINRGGKIHYETEIIELTDTQTVLVTYKDAKGKVHKQTFDKSLVTVPAFLFLKIAPQLPQDYQAALSVFKGIGASNIVLRLSEPFFKDDTYWLSVCDKNAPVMAIVEHTNFMDKVHYNNEHIVYLGNYLAPTDPKFKLSKQELLKQYDPLLKKINPHYQTSLIDYQLFRAPFAQPIVGVNYSRIVPNMITPLPHVYLANIQQVYPWDRGTNYAVELGQKVTQLMA